MRMGGQSVWRLAGQVASPWPLDIVPGSLQQRGSLLWHLAPMLAVVAIDGSPESEAAVEFVSSNCLPPNGQLLVLLCRPQQGSAYSDSHMPPASPVRCRCWPLEDFLPAAAQHPPIAKSVDGISRQRGVQEEASGLALRERFPLAQVGDASAAELHWPTTQVLLATSAASVALRSSPTLQAVEVISAASGSSEAIAQAILDRAQQLHASLVCVVPHTRSAMERVLVGSVTDLVVRSGRGGWGQGWG